MGIFHALYNVQLSDKYENVLKDMCWNDDYLILSLEVQYMGNYNNNVTRISSVETYVWMVDMHTLKLRTCHMLLYRYDAHAASLSFNMSQIGN